MINTATLQNDSIMSLNWHSEVFIPVSSVTRGLSLGCRLHRIGRERDETLINNDHLSLAKVISAQGHIGTRFGSGGQPQSFRLVQVQNFSSFV